MAQAKFEPGTIPLPSMQAFSLPQIHMKDVGILNEKLPPGDDRPALIVHPHHLLASVLFLTTLSDSNHVAKRLV